MRSYIRRCGAIAVVTGIVFVGASAVAQAAGSPSITVTPNTGLTDGQTVQVAYSGFTPNEGLGVAECSKPNPTATDCDVADAQQANGTPSGSGTINQVVRSSFSLLSGGTFDCVATPTCVISVVNTTHQDVTAEASIQFGGNGTTTTVTSTSSGTTDTTSGSTTATTAASGSTSPAVAGAAANRSLANTGAGHLSLLAVVAALVLMLGLGAMFISRRHERITH